MEILLISLIVVVIVGLSLVLFLINNKFQKIEAGKNDDKSLLMIQNQINEINRTLDNKLGESTKILQTQFGQSARIIQDVTSRLTKLDETNKQVIGFANQLQSLQDILQNPKQRGIFGEYYLEALLQNAFQPKQYQMQYKFQDGLIVDAVLFLGDKIIPIDSKFSLENYNRLVEEKDKNHKTELEKTFKQDLKKRIDETAKYIRPNEKTLDFAFMFIPAEGIYYDLLVNKVGAIRVNTRDLLDYAINERRVHIVSPTTFYVTLQSLLQGMKAYKIQESTKEILKNVIKLNKHLGAYQDYLKKLGGHLGTTVNIYNLANKEFSKIDKDVARISGEETSFEPELLDKPSVE